MTREHKVSLTPTQDETGSTTLVHVLKTLLLLFLKLLKTIVLKDIREDKR